MDTWADSSIENPSETIETTVVTGTRTERLQADAPVKVEVLTAETLRSQHAFSLEDGLKTLPGIQLKPIERKFGTEAWIQGISADRILVLIDGEPTSPTTGSSIDLSQISATNVKQIEVVKGASSALYGSQALGGVINVITAQPDAGWHGSIRGDIGSYGERNTGLKDDQDQTDLAHTTQIGRQRLAANLSYANALFYVKGDINLREDEGFQTDPSSVTIEGPYGHRNTGSLMLGLTPNDNSEWRLRYERYDQQLNTQSYLSAPFNLINVRKDNADRERIAFKGDMDFSAGTLTGQIIHEQYETDSIPSVGISRLTEMPMTQANLQWTQDFFDSVTFIGGIQAYEESLQSFKNGGNELVDLGDTAETKQTRRNTEIFAQNEHRFDNWQLVYGIRVQEDSDFGSNSSPKISTRFDFNPQWFIRYGLGTGYRVSNLKERYYILDHSNITPTRGYIVYGNPELEPEESVSNQLNIGYRPNDSIEVDVSFFRNDIENLIEALSFGSEVQNGKKIDLVRYQNINEAVTQGVELSLQIFLQQWRVQAGYTYLDAKDKQTEQRLERRPEHQIKGSFAYTFSSDTEVSLLVNWQSDAIREISGATITSDGWAQADLRVNQPLIIDSLYQLNAYVGIDNINDEIKDFSAPFDNRPEIGRLVYLGFDFDF